MPREKLLPILISLMGVIVPLVIFFIGWNSKDLSVKLISQSEIIDISQSSVDSLLIFYKNQRLSRLSSLTIQVQNAGKLAVSREDFDSDLRIDFGPHANILNAQVVDSSPINLKPMVMIDRNYVIIQPLLLNADDSFVLQVDISGSFQVPKVDARILGIREVKLDVKSGKEESESLLILLGISFLLVIFLQFYTIGGFWTSAFENTSIKLSKAEVMVCIFSFYPIGIALLVTLSRLSDLKTNGLLGLLLLLIVAASGSWIAYRNHKRE